MSNLKKVLRKHLLLMLTILLAFFLRLYKLDKVPPSLYWDEAAMALDAKAIVQTGKDQHGNRWLQAIYPSWGDYKLPGYILTAAPFFKLIRNNPELAVRLPSALAGALTVIAVYFLVKKQFVLGSSDFDPGSGAALITNNLPITTSLLLAISCWHLQFSRAAFEANLALLFNMLAIFFFIKVQKKWYWLLPTLIFSTFGIFTYYSARIFLPVVLFLTWLFYFKHKAKGFLKLWLVLIFLWLLTLPLRNSEVSQKANQFRLSTKNVLNNPKIIKYSSVLIEQDGGGFFPRKIHHRFFYIFKELASNYFDHFSLNFFILSGDPNLRHSSGGIGVLLIVVFIGLIYGEYLLFSRNKKTFLFLNLLILAAFLPASVPYEVPHALRSLNAVVFLNIVAAFGLVQLTKLVRKKKILLFTVYCLLFGQFIFYLSDYYIYYPGRSALFWQKGYKQAVKIVDQEYPNVDKIIFTDKYARAYIYFLLYSSYPINNFQKQRQAFLASHHLDYSETFKIDKIEFRSIRFDKDSQIKNVLLVDGQDKPPYFTTWKNY